MDEAGWLIGIGLVAGMLGGLLGIGGSIVMIPAMTELLGTRQHVYQAAALVVNFFVAVPAVVQHVRVQAVDWQWVSRLLPWAVAASIGGVVCSELPTFRGDGALYLTGVFGLFLFYVASRDVRRMLVGRSHQNRPGPTSETDPTNEMHAEQSGSGHLAMWVAVPTGFISGLLGVGGGVLAVPLQRRILGLPLRIAIANSAAMIVGLSLVGTAFKQYAMVTNHPDKAWLESLTIALCLIPTAIVGSWIGSRLTHLLPVRAVRVAFIALLLVAGLRMGYRAWSGLSAVDGSAISAPPNAELAVRGEHGDWTETDHGEPPISRFGRFLHGSTSSNHR